MIAALVERVGAQILDVSTQAGDFVTLSFRSFACIFKRPFDGRNFLVQLQAVGVLSIPVIALTSLAVSMVFAVQLSYGFRQFQAEGLAAQVEGLAIVRELAPVITGLMMAGRAGTAMAAELGTMQVTEQIDALECLATDPVHYLFVPRLLASMVMLPLLTGFSIYVGFWGGYTLLVGVQGQSAWVYGKDFYKLLAGRDLVIAMVKALVFGLIIALVGCWRGFRTRGGAVEVGNAPTRSVVTSSLWVLIADFFLTKLLLV
jgi:phospholipid/cholesterol/gamma-HCH transport system permease protein